jgi:hypothetical protein
MVDVVAERKRGWIIEGDKHGDSELIDRMDYLAILSEGY